VIGLDFIRKIGSAIKSPFQRERQPDKGSEAQIVFKTPSKIKPISAVRVKVDEFNVFVSQAVKYGDREIIAVGCGDYSEKDKVVTIDSIYTVVDGSGSSAHVRLTAEAQSRLDRALKHWEEKPKHAIIHSHPGLSSFKSNTDDQHGMRMASLLFQGEAVMIIVDPFSSRGIDVSAYAIEPETKDVVKIQFKLVP
jgi:proteasome lid subunit RPN8/RPN11